MQINPLVDTLSPTTADTVARPRRERPPVSRTTVQPLGYRWYPGVKVAADFVFATLLTIPAVPIILLQLPRVCLR